MTWQDLLAALQLEIQQHTLSTFHDEPGPKGVVVTGAFDSLIHWRAYTRLSEMSKKVSDNSAIRRTHNA